MDVIFFPRNDYPNNVEVCTHRLGKKMTYTEQTDGVIYNISYTAFTNMAKERGIKVGCFVNIIDPSITNAVKNILVSDKDDGHVWFDIYSMTESIRNKIVNRQTISQEEWENAYNTELLPFYISIFGKKPVGLSYSYSVTNFKDYTYQFLGGRNSWQNGNTDYGLGYGLPNDQDYSFSRFKSKAPTSCWYDEAKDNNNNDFSDQLNIVSAKIDETLENGGWYHNFTHWHNYWQDGNEQWVEPYLNLLASKNANNEIYFAGYGEAIAYLVYRQIITKVAMYSPIQKKDTLVIQLETKNNLGIDTDLLQVPISVKFSTVGTPLENVGIESSQNLINLGNNEYIIEISYNEYPRGIITKK